jgi:hypothetical protein
MVLLTLIFGSSLPSAVMADTYFPKTHSVNMSDVIAALCPHGGHVTFPSSAGVTIYVNSAAQLIQRLAYPSTTRVFIVITKNITDAPTFNASYSNTTFVSDCGGPFYFLRSSPANSTLNTPINLKGSPQGNITNITFLGIGVYNDAYTVNVTNTSGAANACPGAYIVYYQNTPCPAISVQYSDSISFVAMDIQAGIWVSTSSHLIIDGCNITTRGYDKGVQFINSGNLTSLVDANNVVRNSFIYETSMGGMCQAGTIGLHLYNNHLEDFIWTYFQLSNGVSDVMSCIHVITERTTLYRRASSVHNSDSAAIYAETHMFGGIGNTYRDVYVRDEGPSYCFYLDARNSNTQLQNIICDINGGLPFKYNNGWNNYLTDVWFLNIGGGNHHYPSSFMFSPPKFDDSCNGAYYNPAAWQKTFFNRYNNSVWRINYPHLFVNVCTIDYLDGVPCQTNQTLNRLYYGCSGFPYNATLISAVINNNSHPSDNYSPAKLPIIPGIGLLGGPYFPNMDSVNTFNQTLYPVEAMYRAVDGSPRITNNSQFSLDFPNLYNFPWSTMGPMPVNLTQYVPLRVVPMRPGCGAYNVNLTALTNADISGVFGSRVYYYRSCLVAVTQTGCGTNESACQIDSSGVTQASILEAAASDATTLQWSMVKVSGYGLGIQYTSVSSSTNICANGRSVIAQFFCGSTTIPTTMNSTETSSCIYKFTIITSLACNIY